MIKPLRKRHLQIWTLLLVLLPAIIFFGWLAVPRQPISALLQPDTTKALPVVIQKLEKEHYTINVRTNRDSSQFQLEWINRKTMTAPTAVIYQITTDSTANNVQKELIGRIEARGTYRFALKPGGRPAGSSFILYDFIHKENIDTINF